MVQKWYLQFSEVNVIGFRNLTRAPNSQKYAEIPLTIQKPKATCEIKKKIHLLKMIIQLYFVFKSIITLIAFNMMVSGTVNLDIKM